MKALDQKFNDDLLVDKGDRERAATLYPTVFHVLDHPELRRKFVQCDEPAKASKRRSRVLGFLTVTLASLALFCASGEIVFYSNAAILRPLALAGVICGISSVAIGSFGLLYGRAKSEWLHRRLMSERLRQFHFQTFVFLLPQIVASLHDPQAMATFVSARHTAFERLRAKMEGRLQAVLTAVLGDEEPDVWFEKPPTALPVTQADPVLEPLFDAYGALRIRHQLSYANFRIRDDSRLFSDAVRAQATVLERITFSCIVLLLAIHIVIGAALVAGWIGGIPAGPPSILAAIIIDLAVVGLAARALAEGLAPEREIERNQQYSSACRAILERFEAAASPADRVRVMMEMERLTFDEMRNFLLTNQRARFVM